MATRRVGRTVGGARMADPHTGADVTVGGEGEAAGPGGRSSGLRGRAAWDVGVAAFLVTVCLIAIWELRDAPPGTFEPLGSGPVPRVTASLVILLSLWVAWRAWRRPADRPVDLGYEPRPWDAAVVSGLTVLYVVAMASRALGFAPLTALFLIASIGWLVRFRPRLMPWVILVAAVTGWGCAYIFTRVFVVDLPGL